MKMKPKPMTWHDCVTPLYSGNATDAQYEGKLLLVHCEYRIDSLRLKFHAFRRYKVCIGGFRISQTGRSNPRGRGANLLFGKIYDENCFENERNWTERG